MLRFLIVALLALLLVVGCGQGEAQKTGGSGSGGGTTPASTGMAKVKGIVDSAIAATEKFNASAAAASGPEEFAAALSELAKTWGGYGKALYGQIDALAGTGLSADVFKTEVDRLDPALAKREELFTAVLDGKGWAEHPKVRAAIEEFVSANESWE